MSVRISPLERPFEAEVEDQLRSMMPPNVEPIALFRVFARNLKMARAMQAWGRYELGKAFSVGIRHREIVIDRTCARCGCEYEWGGSCRFLRRTGLPYSGPSGLAHQGPFGGPLLG